LAHFSNNAELARPNLASSTQNFADSETQHTFSNNLLNSFSSRPIRGSSRVFNSSMHPNDKILMSMQSASPQITSLPEARSHSSLLIEAKRLNPNELMFNPNLYQIDHQQQQLELLKHQLINMLYLKELKQLQSRQSQSFGIPVGFEFNQAKQEPINTMSKSFTWNHLNSLNESSIGLTPLAPANSTTSITVNSSNPSVAASTSLGTNSYYNLFNPINENHASF
jgi:hypothetical protein